MLHRMRKNLTYANVMSSLTFFLVLAGGSAYAANSIRSEDIVNGQVKNADIGTEAVGNSKIHYGSVTSSKILNGGIGGIDLAGDSVTGGKVAPDSLTGDDVEEGSLGKVPAAVEADMAGKAAVQGMEVLWKLKVPNGQVSKESTVDIDCPAGKRPIGGGGWGYSSAIQGPTNDDVAITKSAPSGNIYSDGDHFGHGVPTGWTVTARGMEDPWNAAIYVGVWVTCAKTDLQP